MTMCFACAAAAPPKHRVTFADLQGFQSPIALQLSPDGRTLAYVVAPAGKLFGGDLWLVDTQDGSAAQRLCEGTLPSWSPDGSKLAYYAYSKPASAPQLWLFDLASKRTVQLTSLIEGVDPDLRARMIGSVFDPLQVSWSPDGRQLLFTSQVAMQIGAEASASKPGDDVIAKAVRKPGIPLVLTLDTPPEWTLSGVFLHGFNPPRVKDGTISHDGNGSRDRLVEKVNQLFTIDIETRAVTQLTDGRDGHFNPDWSPDGKSILFASNEGRSLASGSVATNIYSFDLASGAATALTTGPGDKWLPKWSPDGRHIAYWKDGARGVQVIPATRDVPGSLIDVAAKIDRLPGTARHRSARRDSAPASVMHVHPNELRQRIAAALLLGCLIAVSMGDDLHETCEADSLISSRQEHDHDQRSASCLGANPLGETPKALTSEL